MNKTVDFVETRGAGSADEQRQGNPSSYLFSPLFQRFMMATITQLACWAPSAMQRCWVLMSTALPARCGLNSSRMEMAQIKVLSCSFLVSMEAANPAAGEKVFREVLESLYCSYREAVFGTKPLRKINLPIKGV